MVAERSKAWTVFAHSDAGIVGSNLTQGMNVSCVYVYSVYLGRGLATGRSLVQGVLPVVYRYKGKNENLDTVRIRYKRKGYKKILKIFIKTLW
jgi:hypothetical protein